MRDLVMEWTNFLVIQRGLAGGTVRVYRAAVLEFLRFLEGRGIRKPREVVRQHIDAFLRALFDGHNSNPTRAVKLSAIKSFFDYLVYVGALGSSPTAGVPTPKFTPPTPKPFRSSEIRRLLAQPARHTLIGRRDLAIFYVLLGAGLRAGELLGLDLGDVYDTGAYMRLTVLGKGSKERLLLLKRRPALVLRAWLLERRGLASPDDALFVSLRGEATRLSKAGLEAVLSRHGVAAKVRDVHPHRFRSTFATMLYDGGHDIRKICALMGWSERSGMVTAMRYIKVSQRYLRQTAIPDTIWRELELGSGPETEGGAPENGDNAKPAEDLLGI